MHGRWFSSIRGMNWLGDHSSLILIPLAPLFALAPHPLTLLAFQSVALALGALPVWALARREFRAGPMPVMCAALYLLQPALGYLNLFEFHPETLAVPFLLWCAYEVRRGRTARAALAAGIALLAREDVPLPIFGLALVALLARPRQTRTAGVLAGLALASLVLSFGVLKPLLLSGQAEYGQMYQRWGATPLGVIAGLATHPLDAIAALFTSPGDPADSLRKQQMWFHLFLPVAGLSFLAPLWLLPALPVLAEHLLSERSHQHTIVFQYTALALPFIVTSAVLGLRRVCAWYERVDPGARAAWAGALVLALALTTQVMFGAIAGRKVWQVRAASEAIWPDAFERSVRPYRDRMLARIPRDGAVIAAFDFLSHLATRRDVHSMHHILAGTYTYSSRPYPVPEKVSAIVGDLCGMIPHFRFDSGRRVRDIIARSNLKPADAAGGIVLMLPGATDPVELWRVGVQWTDPTLDLIADDQLRLLGARSLDSVVVAGNVARIEACWQRVAVPNRNYLSQAWLIEHGRVGAYGRARPLAYGMFPATDWPADSLVSEYYHLLIPDDLAPGYYTPLFRLVGVDANGVQSVPIVQVGKVREPMNAVGLGAIHVLAAKR
jgi:hypothetical protein